MPQRDIAPFTFTIGNLIVAWGLFRYGLFDLTPIARSHILENMNDPVIVLDTANRVVDINLAALASMEKQLSEVIGRLPNEVFTKWPDVAVMLDASNSQSKEITVKTNDDALFYDVNISPIIDNDHKMIGKIVVARDVTRQKILEVSYRILSEELEKRVRERTKELVQSEDKFYKAFQVSPDAIILSELKSGRLVEVNDGFEKIFGYQRTEVIGRTPQEINLYTNSSERKRLVGALEKYGQVHIKEYKIKTKDGQERLVQVSGKLIDINGKPHIVIINHDITEQKQAEARVLRLNRLYITMS